MSNNQTMNDSLTNDFDTITITGGTNSPPYITSSTLNISEDIEYVFDFNSIQDRSFIVQGNAEIAGDIIIAGTSLNERLDRIESRLAIVNTNLQMEERWQQLKQLGDQYRRLESELIEQEWIFEQLKK
jgi:galactitol-specific phosphotransferase system IIB component